MKRALAIALALWLVGCDHGQESVIGPSEAFRIRGAQFMKGALPGTAASDAGTATPVDAGGPPRVTMVALSSGYAIQGQSGRGISGLSTPNAASVGIALDDVGSGYWVVPTRTIDQTTGELTWSATADFDRSIPAGRRFLHFVAFDESGTPGEQLAQKFCIASSIPDNLSSCDPSVEPPAAVISLTWDTNVDLDLQVVTPAGVVVTPKHPSTEPPDAGTDAGADADAGVNYGAVGTIDRDSNANCITDGVRMENLVFPKDAPLGTYQIFANLFDACKQPNVHFDVAVYTAEPSDGGKKLTLSYQRGGELVDSQADPTAGRGLFVTEFLFVP